MRPLSARTRSSPRFPWQATSATTSRWRRGCATLLAVRLASELGVRGEALSAVYYVGPLRFIGCSGYADETSKVFPDDNGMRGAMARVDFGYPVEGLRQAATLGRGALGRTRAIATMVVRGKRLGEELQRADWETSSR